MVEKPLSTDAQQARRLCQKAEETGRRIFVGCVLRFSESLNRFRDVIETIGQLHSVHIECQSYLPNWRPDRPYRDSYSARAQEGGVLRDLIHEIDYAAWLFGWPAFLQAQVKNLSRLDIAADEAADLMWETANGCMVTMRLDYLSRPARRQMKAYGEKGTLEWDGGANTVVMALAEHSMETLVSRQTRQDMMIAQARAFIGATSGGEIGQLATGLEGGKALAICDAARRAAARNRTEPVEY